MKQLKTIKFPGMSEAHELVDAYAREQISDMKATAAKLVNTTTFLYHTNWSDNTQVVSAPGVTANNVVIVSPDVESQAAYSDAGILCRSQGEDALTFTCDFKPTKTLTVNVIILSA